MLAHRSKYAFQGLEIALSVHVLRSRSGGFLGTASHSCHVSNGCVGRTASFLFVPGSSSTRLHIESTEAIKVDVTVNSQIEHPSSKFLSNSRRFQPFPTAFEAAAVPLSHLSSHRGSRPTRVAHLTSQSSPSDHPDILHHITISFT